MNSFLTLLSFLGQSAGKPASHEALRYWPWNFRIAPADPQDTERDNVFEMDGKEERILLALSWTAISPTALTALPTGGASWSLDRIDLILQHDLVDLIIPELESDVSPATYVRSSFQDLATAHEPVPHQVAAGDPRWTQRARGFNPLLYRIGPGGHVRIGGRKTLAAGVGEEWYIQGSLLSWKV